MKKMIAIILLCMLCATACAKKPEGFTIRNGIKFGMSAEEVIAIEGKPLYQLGDGIVVYDDEICSKYAQFTYFTGDAEMAYDGWFEYSHIDNADYYFPTAPSDTDGISLFEEIDEELKSKYGKPTIDRVVSKEGSIIYLMGWTEKDIKVGNVYIYHVMEISDGYTMSHEIYYTTVRNHISMLYPELERVIAADKTSDMDKL